MATRNDVAAKAGVSPALVSYVLNGSNYVSEEKRKAVLQAVEELGYHPNYAARSLKINKTNQLLLVSDDIRNELFSDMAYHMERMAFERGYYLSTTSCSPKKAIDFEKVFYTRQYDAILLANNVYSVQEINRIAGKGVPIVLFQTRFYEGLDPSVTVVGADFKDGIAQLVHYLADKGHKKIGYISDPSIPVTPGETGRFGEGIRVNSYLKTMAQRGLEVCPECMFTSYLHPTPNNCLPDNDSMEQMLENVARKILSNRDNPERATAYMAISDRLAALLVMQLQEHGLRIPQDLEITGFGDTISGRLCRPQLTTIHIPTVEIAAFALEALLSKCDGKTPPNTLFPLQLVVRQSA